MKSGYSSDKQTVTIGSFDFDVQLYTDEAGDAHEVLRCFESSRIHNSDGETSIAAGLDQVGKTEDEIIILAIEQEMENHDE